MMKKSIFHGSNIQGLKIVNSHKSRFGEKIFGSYSFQRALTYCASRESCGTSVLERRNNLFILNSKPEEILNECGSVYVLDSEGFVFDDHKGKDKEWVFSINEAVTPILEIQLPHLLFYWNSNNVYAANEEDTLRLEKSDYSGDILEEIIEKKRSLIEKCNNKEAN